MSKWATDEERHVGNALSAARRTLIGLKRQNIRGKDIVWQTIKDVTEIKKHIERHSGAVGPVPLRAQQILYFHSPEEIRQIEKERLLDAAAGISHGEDRKVATPEEISRLDAVLYVFRNCLVGKEAMQRRDWKIINDLAMGRTFRRVGAEHDISKSAVGDRRDLQCWAIWTKLGHLMPKAIETGRVLKAA
jgi:hypothetical protein